ncbi:MAG TPA: tetratricopeptide repeat protein [Candidatus Binatus sp.]|nr:tetratricopeptide repeat protein [Candidatus Binatus sp.]
MKITFCLGHLSWIILLTGCSAYQTSSQIEAGRQNLLAGKSQAAIGYFEDAAQKDPDYKRSIGYMHEGIWTYLGRANYDAGKLPEARRALERAVELDDRDYLGQLYLGLALAKTENHQPGIKHIENGLQGLNEWFQYTKKNAYYGQNWDPLNAIGSEIGVNLAMISGRDIDWPKLISSSEWVGKKTEEEIDLARRDELRQYDNDNMGRRIRRR